MVKTNAFTNLAGATKTGCMYNTIKQNTHTAQEAQKTCESCVCMNRWCRGYRRKCSTRCRLSQSISPHSMQSQICGDRWVVRVVWVWQGGWRCRTRVMAEPAHIECHPSELALPRTLSETLALRGNERARLAVDKLDVVSELPLYHRFEASLVYVAVMVAEWCRARHCFGASHEVSRDEERTVG